MMGPNRAVFLRGDVSMSRDPVPAKSRRIGLVRFTAVVLFAFLFLPVHLPGQTASSNAVQAGTLADLHSDRRVVQNGRWFLVREFTVDFCGTERRADLTAAKSRPPMRPRHMI
jgi:hypothetical protein